MSIYVIPFICQMFNTVRLSRIEFLGVRTRDPRSTSGKFLATQPIAAMHSWCGSPTCSLEMQWYLPTEVVCGGPRSGIYLVMMLKKCSQNGPSCSEYCSIDRPWVVQSSQTISPSFTTTDHNTFWGSTARDLPCLRRLYSIQRHLRRRLEHTYYIICLENSKFFHGLLLCYVSIGDIIAVVGCCGP